MEIIKKIKLFVSCPSDIKDELNSIKYIIDEINKTSGKYGGYIIEILNWKYDTYTDVGSDPQEVINKQLENQYDILIGLLWTKAGTPTKRDKSGTIEEINRSLANKSKAQLLFFRTSPPDNIYNIDMEQMGILKKFREDLGNRGVLYKEYDSVDTFEQLFRINITSLIADKFVSEISKIERNDETLEAVPIVTEKYSDILSLINEVESRDESYLNIDIEVLVQEGIDSLNNVAFSLDSMTSSLTFFSEVLRKRTSEVTRYNNIKDNNLRNSKIKNSVNHLADELLEFNRRVDEELPIYSDNFRVVGKVYSQIMLALPHDLKEVNELRENIRSLRDGVKSAVDEGALFLKTIIDLPLINTKFNKSKRETEITVKNMIKTTLDGLLILDELLE